MPERTIRLAGLPVKVSDAEAHRSFWDLADAGNWEPATLAAISRLTDGGVYIDVGAWIGPTVMTAARKASLVVAYEPDPAAAAELHRNIDLNALTNVEVRELALLDRDGELPLGPGMFDELGLSVSSLVYGQRTLMVPVRDARHEATSDVFMRCLLLKIDVEGAEYRLISRLSSYLRKRRPTLLLSLHGIHWRRRSFAHLPQPVAMMYRRLGSILERVPLVWHLRHYPHIYVEEGARWRATSRAELWALVFDMAEKELLLSNRSFPGNDPDVYEPDLPNVLNLTTGVQPRCNARSSSTAVTGSRHWPAWLDGSRRSARTRSIYWTMIRAIRRSSNTTRRRLMR